MYDYLIVGAGLFGCTFGRLMAEGGKRCLIIDKRNHIGGNCYTENIEGINVHRYGPHIFHTNNARVWEFVNQFSKFNNFQLHTKVSYGGQRFSFPLNLMTLHQLWPEITTPEQARAKINAVRRDIWNPTNLEEYCLSTIGDELYETFIKGYTTKQWGCSPKELPVSIIKRLPVRFNYDDRYFEDKYQGIPCDGYTAMFVNMLDHPSIDVSLSTTFNGSIKTQAQRTVYSGPIDQLYDCRFGSLDYRSLRFETQTLSQEDYQGNAIINHTSHSEAFTRTVEHKHFEFKKSPNTVVTWEYPQTYLMGDNEPYYPIRDANNTERLQQYLKLAKAEGMLVGGRLGTYQYFDMHQVIAQAISLAETELGERREKSL